MKNIITKYKFDVIWHFTDRSNIELIKQHRGLLPLSELEKKGVKVPAFGGNQWSHDADRQKGLHQYVHLAFLDDHPMLYIAKQDGRITDPIWLKIDSSIILESGVLFCSDVSNKSGVATIDSNQAKHQIDFDVLFTYMDWTAPEIQIRRQSAIKSEILVPHVIPIEKILGYKNG